MQNPVMSANFKGTYYTNKPYRGYWYHKSPEGAYSYYGENLNPAGEYRYGDRPPDDREYWSALEGYGERLGTLDYPEWTPTIPSLDRPEYSIDSPPGMRMYPERKSGFDMPDIPLPGSQRQPTSLFDIPGSSPEITTPEMDKYYRQKQSLDMPGWTEPQWRPTPTPGIPGSQWQPKDLSDLRITPPETHMYPGQKSSPDILGLPDFSKSPWQTRSLFDMQVPFEREEEGGEEGGGQGGGKDKVRKESLDALVDRIYGSSQKSIAEQQKFSKAKAITDTLLTAGSMLGQMTAGSPRPVSPAMVTPPTYQSVIPEYKSAIDRSSAGSLAAATKIAQETGRPELMPAYLAKVLANQNKAYSELATKDIEQRNLQSIAVADALSKTDANRYEAQVAYDDMLDKINLKRSEDLAAMSKSLFSTIPNAYMTNQQSLIDAGNKMELYRYYIKEGHKYFPSFEEFRKTFGIGVPTTETTETPREQGKD